MKQLCCWCEKSLPNKHIEDDKGFIYCGQSCVSDREKNKYPSWVTGRIGPDPPKNWYVIFGILCLSAPNKYRQIYRKKLPDDEIAASIIEEQIKQFPWINNPIGIGIDPYSWDTVIMWENQTVIDALRGQ